MCEVPDELMNCYQSTRVEPIITQISHCPRPPGANTTPSGRQVSFSEGLDVLVGGGGGRHSVLESLQAVYKCVCK